MQKSDPYSTDEKDAAQYTLPDPLLKEDVARVASAAEWMQSQRSKILALLKQYEYGEILPRPDHRMEFQLLSRREDALHNIISGDISFHYRTGQHDQTLFDWQHYLLLADQYL